MAAILSSRAGAPACTDGIAGWGFRSLSWSPSTYCLCQMRDRSSNGSSPRSDRYHHVAGPACCPTAYPIAGSTDDCRADRRGRAAHSPQAAPALRGTLRARGVKPRSRAALHRAVAGPRACMPDSRRAVPASTSSRVATPRRSSSSYALAPARRWILHTGRDTPARRSIALTRSTDPWKEI